MADDDVVGTIAAQRQWSAVREALARTADRYAALLHGVRNPAAPALHGWSIAQLAAHVTVVSSLDLHTATNGEVSFVAPELLELAFSATITDIARLNTLSLHRVTERDPHVLAEQLRRDVELILRVTADGDGSAVGLWLGGARLTVCAMLAHLLNELLLHGHDVARAERRPWPIPAADAATAFRSFLLPVLAGNSGQLMVADGPVTPGRVRAEVRGHHHEPVTVLAENGRLTVEPVAAGPVDLRIWNDPAALMLVLWGRSGRLRPLLTGRVRIWGRRPWRIFRFLAAARTP